MLDRQDIDALLVGALYGELSSADEAALTAHLDSHPADRSALDDLKSIRTKFQSSRIFELQFEPPQALSALLLQEAARRAPKIEVRKEGWFPRFVTLFVAHPAMAAAATLVLVVGVAGTVYVKNDRPVEPTASQDLTRLPAPTPPAAVAAWGSAAKADPTNMDGIDGKEATAGDGRHKGQGQDTVAVALAEEQVQKKLEDTGKDVRKNKVESKPQFHTSPKRDELAFGGAGGGRYEATPDEMPAPANKPAATRPYVEVGSTERGPKDLERGMADDKVAAEAPATGAAAGPNGSPGNSRASSATVSSNGVAKPAQIAAAPATPEPPATTKSATRPDTNLAWAKDTHARVTALVKEGKCQAAAPLAIAIRNRTPDYYNSYVATDRELKPCMPYITDATEHSERSAPKAAKATDTK
ncbi:MAG: hypothetical protein ABI591_29345 [Kofleriaceae bacterium]